MPDIIPPPSIIGICAAHHAMDPRLRDTPFFDRAAANAKLGCQVSVKAEVLNPIRAAEGRGADWLFAGQMKRAEPLVTASPGNFGLGLAYAAQKQQRRLIVFAPEGINQAKLEAMQQLGADVRLEGSDLLGAKAAARAFAEAQGFPFLDDGAHPRVVEGYGTIGREMTASAQAFDTVLVPIGAGAIAAGIGLWLKTEQPNVRVIGLVPETNPTMLHSWRAQKVVTGQAGDLPTIADSLAMQQPETYALDLLLRTISDVWSVRDGAMLAGMRFCHEEYGLIVEPTGAIGIGAILERAAEFEGRKVATLLVGGNMTPDQIKSYLG